MTKDEAKRLCYAFAQAYYENREKWNTEEQRVIDALAPLLAALTASTAPASEGEYKVELYIPDEGESYAFCMVDVDGRFKEGDRVRVTRVREGE